MESPSTIKAHYGAFNARWLSSEEVARTFVPVPQFRQLVHNSHAALLGPRGCGKTTLLKMLTRRALAEWDSHDRAKRFKGAFDKPPFEAVYIPSDIRWSYELESLRTEPFLTDSLAHQVQRAMVTCGSLRSVVTTLSDLVARDRKAEAAICSALISRWNLEQTISQFTDVRLSLDKLAFTIRSLLLFGKEDELERSLANLPTLFYSFALDAPIDACLVATEAMPPALRPARWALCYDELEISPVWLRSELLAALRSVQQEFLLKLTWSPLLPSGIRTAPDAASDFRAIRLWSSHIQDPRAFCENLAQDFLNDRFPDRGVTPDSFLSRSILAADPDEEPPDAYEVGSTEHVVFKEVAERDESFHRLLKERGLDPSDPVPRSGEDKDQFFRKVKPIALLRREFVLPGKERSRKSVTLFAGKQAVYAMSEGNPRWLLGLLNDLADFGTSLSDLAIKGMVTVKYKDQARLLTNASRRFLTQIKANPTRDREHLTLFDFICRIGTTFSGELYDRDFPLDPIGSFEVPVGTDRSTIHNVEQLLELGALIHVGRSQQEVPTQVEGSRFRLTFLLAPAFRLPFRTYRPTGVGEALSGRALAGQLELGLP